jgi:hypothetical protein
MKPSLIKTPSFTSMMRGQDEELISKALFPSSWQAFEIKVFLKIYTNVWWVGGISNCNG